MTTTGAGAVDGAVVGWATALVPGATRAARARMAAADADLAVMGDSREGRGRDGVVIRMSDGLRIGGIERALGVGRVEGGRLAGPLALDDGEQGGEDEEGGGG